MERSSTMKEKNSCAQNGRKQQNTKNRFASQTNFQLTNSTLGVGDTKKFTKRDLTEACRKLHPQHNTGNDGFCSSKVRKNRVHQEMNDKDVGNQLKVLDAGVKLCARKYNECKATGDKIEVVLHRKLDEHSGLMREALALGDMINGSNPEAKSITKLSNSIEEAHESSEGKLCYRLKLNHILSRLRKNSISLDAHMSAMSDTIESAEKEKQKCEKMLGEIESAHTAALRELEGTNHCVEVERAQRQRAMADRKIDVTNAESIENWRNERESSRVQLEQTLGGAHHREKEKRSRTLKEREVDLENLNAATETKTQQLGLLEEAFTHIKQATGVNTLTEMVDKFTNHQEHHDRLLVEKKEAEEKLAAAKNSLEMAHDRFDQVKAEGFGDTQLSREIINHISETILKEKTEGKVVKSTNNRLEGVLVGLRQGGMGLYQRFLAFHPTLLDGEAPNISESATASAIQAAYDTLEMLKVTEQILGKMLDSVGGLETIADHSSFKITSVPPNTTDRTTNHFNSHSINYMKDDLQSIDTFTSNETIDTLENPNLGDNNCRIKAKKETPRYSDEESHNTNTEAYYDDILNDDTMEAPENKVPSRNFLKTSSEQQAGEAKRLAELEEKRRKILEKAAVDDTEQSDLAATKKRQKEASEKLAQHTLPIGLPKSLSIRDDPMTKAQAFLTESPNLE